MKKILSLAAMAAVLGAPWATALELGDPAPELKLSKIIKGEELKAGSGVIKVVEFWATWCGPCRQSIPHLTELQEKYKDKNVRIIGVSDETEAQVSGFVEQQGEEMDYTVALDDSDRSTWDAYATPFGVKGIPHAFVVDSEGTLVWQGHPLQGLDDVLAKVVEGTFDIEAARAQEAKSAMQEELGELTMLWAREYLVLSKYARDIESAGKVGQRLLSSGYEDGEFFGQLAWTLLSDQGLKHQDLDFMLNLAELANTLAEGKSADILDTLAFAHFRNGNVEKAIATQERAIELCENDDLMAQLKQRMANYKNQ